MYSALLLTNVFIYTNTIVIYSRNNLKLGILFLFSKNGYKIILSSNYHYKVKYFEFNRFNSA